MADISKVQFARYTGGGDIQSWIKAACELVGVPANANWTGGLKVLCQRESSDLPNNINRTDRNATGPLQMDIRKIVRVA
jgi:hypothetical protein